MPLYSTNGSLQQVVCNSNTPSLVLGVAAGPGASVSIVGSNTSGKITFTSGTGILSSGIVMTMTFSNSYAYPTDCVPSFASGNSNFSQVVSLIYCTTSPSTVILSVSAALSISTTYIGYYTITGY